MGLGLPMKVRLSDQGGQERSCLCLCTGVTSGDVKQAWPQFHLHKCMSHPSCLAFLLNEVLGCLLGTRRY